MEQRLIDANALLERLERKKCEPAKVRYTEGYNDALMRFRSMVHGAPTVDAVPVTRCIDCKHSMKVDGMIGLVWCDHLAEVGAWVENDFYCADGERKDGEHERQTED